MFLFHYITFILLLTDHFEFDKLFLQCLRKFSFFSRCTNYFKPLGLAGKCHIIKLKKELFFRGHSKLFLFSEIHGSHRTKQMLILQNMMHFCRLSYQTVNKVVKLSSNLNIYSIRIQYKHQCGRNLNPKNIIYDNKTLSGGLFYCRMRSQVF